MEERLTENFRLSEFLRSETAKELGIENVPTPNAYDNLRRLANYLQTIRNCYGKPMTISSGYRCKKLNDNTKGASKTSQHLTGEACDIVTGSRAENRRLFEMIRKMGGFDQLIDEKDFAWVHVSHRAGNNRGEVLKYDGKNYFRI